MGTIDRPVVFSVGTQLDCQRRIQSLVSTIEASHAAIRAIAKEHIPEFHFLDHQVSTFWKCNDSPIGMCVFKIEQDSRGQYGPTTCAYCGGPTERK